MSNDLEANYEIAESPLLSMDDRKTARVAPAAISAFTLAREGIVEESPAGLELTSVHVDVTYRLRVAYTALRGVMAFSRAGYARAENHNELLDELLVSSPPHTVINLEQNWLSNLVQSRSTEHLSRFGSVHAVAKALGTDIENGIHDNSITGMRQNYGSNRIEMQSPAILETVLETIKDPVIIILLICAELSLGFGVLKNGPKGLSDGGSIFAAVGIVIAITAYCKIWPRIKIFQLLTASDNFPVDVMRNGQKHSISVFDAVVGDIICLKPGDQVPADGLYIYGTSLQVDESNMTEAMGSPRIKDIKDDPFLLSGSKVRDGSGRMLVTAVGMNTARAKMLIRNHSDANQKTLLEMNLHKLAMLIAKVGFVAASLVLVVYLMRYFTGNMRDGDGKPEFLAGKTRIHDVCSAVIGILTTPFAIASTAIPEGLLLAVTIPIAHSTYRMAAAQKALVRNLSALEKIGSTTIICTNERGILTTHNLKVIFWFGQDTFSPITPSVPEHLLQGVLSDNTQVSTGSLSDTIELALKDWAFQQKNVNIELVRAFPFQKGDPEDTLAKCSQYCDNQGHIMDITDDLREHLKQKIMEMKSKCLQCVAFSCYSPISEDNENSIENLHPKLGKGYFTLIAFAGLAYQCSAEVKEAMLDCQRAGVNVKLITRSELPLARAIAYDCGILDQNQDTTTGEVVEGLQFENYPKEERMEKLDKIRVMARASTMKRFHMVNGLKEKGHVVAVIGDSIGDAEVLKQADVGFSLGIQGTNIAKESSDFIILNDNFSSVATALKWGRGMYYKIQTYTQFLLTVSISSLVIDFTTAISAREPPNFKVVTAISAGDVPFAAVQVLWVKLIVGVLAALAITVEEPTQELQQLPSVKETQPFITCSMWRNIVGQAMYPIITLLSLYFKADCFNLDPKVKDTMIFNIFVLWQLFTIFTTKRFEINVIKGMQKEKLFWTIIGTIIFLQVVIVEVLQRFADTERLNWKQWAACIGIAVPAWPMGWLVRKINIFFDAFLQLR